MDDLLLLGKCSSIRRGKKGIIMVMEEIVKKDKEDLYSVNFMSILC